MIATYFYSLGSVAIVSLISFVGIFTLFIRTDVLRKHIFLLVSLAVGALLGDAFINLIPEAFRTIANPVWISIAVIAGILVFFVIEKFLHWHHHAVGDESCGTVHSAGRIILLSDGIHNFIDGLIIGGSYLVSAEIGIATTIAVISHEIPQEIGDFGVLLYSGYGKAKALLFNFLSALSSVAGAVVALAIAGVSEILVIWLIPIAAGGFIYIALSDLIPELHKTDGAKKSFLQLVAVIAGVGTILLLLMLE